MKRQHQRDWNQGRDLKRALLMEYKLQSVSPKIVQKQNIEGRMFSEQQEYSQLRSNGQFEMKHRQPHLSEESVSLDLYRPVPCLNDNFADHFRNNSIDQWYESSIRFYQMQPYLQAAIKIHEDNCQTIIEDQQKKIRLLPLDVKKMSCMRQVQHFICKLTNAGYHKYMHFLEFKLSQILHQWQQLYLTLQQSSVVQIRTHQHCLKRHYIKQIIKIIFTNLHCLNLFIKINQQCLEYIHQVQNNIIYPMIKKEGYYLNKKQKGLFQYYGNRCNKENRRSFGSIYKDSKQEDFQNKNLTRKRSHDNIPHQQQQQQQQNKKQNKYGFVDIEREKQITKVAFEIQQACRSLYGQMVYMDEKKTNRLQNILVLNIGATQNKETSKKDFFLTGVFIGVTLLTIVTMLGLFFTDYIGIYDDQTDINSFIYIFPSFRGIGLFILYMWGNAWNVYGFSKFNVNYRFILQYGTHYSTFFQLVKRAGFFTLVFIGAFLFYVIGQQLNIKNKENIVPVVYSPFFIWILFFGYIFFPNRDVFNPRGRKYFYKLLKEVIKSPIGPMTFLISYATDQSVSFVVPIKDMAYSICYYTSKLEAQSVKNCLNTTHFQGVIVTYIVAIIPLLLRMFQCYNQAVQQSGKFRGHIQFWNFFKYTASLTTATISFISSFYEPLFYVFVVSSIISTLYSYYWDLKNDWGLLQKNSNNKFLRNTLSYKNPNIYYFAIGINLIMRCSWTLTISASITSIIPKSTFLPFLTGLIEILRRCMWNFFRIQKEHIQNCANFRITKDVQPIFESINRSRDLTSKQLKDQTLLNSLLEGDSFFYMHSQQALAKNVPIVASIAESQVNTKQEEFKTALQKEKKIIKQSQRNSKLQKALKLI